MRNSIFTDPDCWAELREIEAEAERLHDAAEGIKGSDYEPITKALLALGKRVEALTYVVARIGGENE